MSKLSKYFPEGSQKFIELILKYLRYIDPKIYKIDIYYDTYNDNKQTMNIKINNKVEIIECMLLSKYDKKSEIFKWRQGLNEHYKNKIYDKYSDIFKIDKFAASKIPIEDIFRDEYKIEDALSYIIPHIFVLFYPENNIVFGEDDNTKYSFLVKLNLDNKINTGDVIMDIIEFNKYFYLSRNQSKVKTKATKKLLKSPKINKAKKLSKKINKKLSRKLSKKK